MHVPDGFLDPQTSVATAAIAIGAVGLSLMKAEPEIRRTGPALPGLTAAFIFAVQMVNFPVGAGTSGHLLGGALAAALVGPWTAVLVMTVVLLVQGLLFADGGLTALGTNVLLMGVVSVVAGYAVTRVIVTLSGRRRGAVVPAAAFGALVSVPAAALGFVALYAIGGAVGIPLTSLTTAMVGWHLLIGLGEAVITGAVLGAVVATRPDLVHLTRDLVRDLVIVGADGSTRTVTAGSGPGASAGAPARQAAGRRSLRRPAAVAGLVTLLVAGGASLLASAHPDGLEYVAGSLGFDTAAGEALVTTPFADYGVSGITEIWSTSLAGVVGVAATLAVALLLTGLVGLRVRRTVPELADLADLPEAERRVRR